MPARSLLPSCPASSSMTLLHQTRRLGSCSPSGALCWCCKLLPTASVPPSHRCLLKHCVPHKVTVPSAGAAVVPTGAPTGVHYGLLLRQLPLLGLHHVRLRRNEVGMVGRFGTKGLAITFVSSAPGSDVPNQMQERIKIDIKELPEQIETLTYTSD